MNVISLDIETTSLSPQEGDIIEVAAIRYDFETTQEVARFCQLIRPRTPISPFITELTGINDAMVAAAPDLAAVGPKLQEFVGDAIITAHNASFDLGFLQQKGVDLSKNPVWDTFFLASIAWPKAGSYNLGTLAESLSIKGEGDEHRALHDALVGFALLTKIVPRLRVSQDSYQSIQEILRKSGLLHYLRLFSHNAVQASSPSHTASIQTQPPIKNASLNSLLGEKGVLSERIPGFSYRSEQLAMAKMVADTHRERGVSLIEAPTGTGKTYGYLVPSLLELTAPQVDETGHLGTPALIVSTFTKNLQDQLYTIDLPRLLDALGMRYRVASLKGRRNYLCTTRWRALLSRPTFNPETAWLLIKIELWLWQGGRGDLEELHIPYRGKWLMAALHADSVICRLSCSQHSDCFYQIRRQEALASDIVVTNHALIMQSTQGDRVFENTPHVVIDEAHHLPESARQASRIYFTIERLKEILHLLDQVLRQVRSAPVPLIQETDHVVKGYQGFLEDVGIFLQRHSPRGRFRLSPEARRSSGWKQLVKKGEEWSSHLRFITGTIRSLPLIKEKNKELKDEAIRQTDLLCQEFERFLHGSSERIQWLELAANTDPAVTLADKVRLLDVAFSIHPLITQLRGQSRSLVLTSATLTSDPAFSYIKRILGLAEAKTLLLGASTFSYRDQMLIYIIDDGPYPQDASFPRFLAEIVVAVGKSLRGRMLGLFTSYSSLNSVDSLSRSSLYKDNIKLLSQGKSGSRHAIVERFKHHPNTILMGTSSFWEGIDIPGEELSCVFIPKLPFPLPDDPVIESLAEADSVDAFSQLSVPHMILRLRQGVGRLLRSSTDRGVVIFADGRFLRSAYGEGVLRNLPPATIKIGSKNELLPAIEHWFGEATLQRWRSGG